MSDLPSNPDLEVVLGCAYLSDTRTAKDNKRRTIADTLAHLVTALTDAKLEYVIAGAMARSLYAPARYTKDIDVLALDESRGKIKKALTVAGFVLRDDLPYQLTWKDPQSSVEVDILLGEIDPERSAVEDPGKARLLNVPALVIKPEYLLWMYCLSDLAKHFADAVDLIKGGKVDLRKLRQYLEWAEDDVAAEALNKALQKADREGSSTYSSSAAARRNK